MNKINKRNSNYVNSSSNDENILSMYLKEINKINLLTRKEEDTAARLAAKGDLEAQRQLIKANLRFVVNVAKKYQNQGLPLSDLISEGNIGLMNAIDRYNVDAGYHFISYAVWWIRQAILKAICEKSRMIRLPLNRANELVQIEKARKELIDANGSEPDIEEIAKILSMDKKNVSSLLKISREHISLEVPVYEDNDSASLSDYIEDDSYKKPEEELIEKSLKSDIEEILETLSEKESEIIKFRFGLNNRRPMSLKEIGDRYNLTKERIRQIEKKALTRLRHPNRSRFLESYIA